MGVIFPLVNSVYPVFLQYWDKPYELFLVDHYDPPSWWFIQVCGVCDSPRLEEPDPPVFWVCEALRGSIPPGGKFDGGGHGILLYPIRDQRR